MSEAVKLFRQALSEEGLNADVSHESDNADMTETIYVSKTIGGEEYVYKTTITHKEIVNAGDTQKLMAMRARNVYQQFREHIEETLHWENRRLHFSPHDEPYATCAHCGTEVFLSESRASPMFAKEAELSTPQPVPRSREEMVNDLDDNERVLLTMYLLGKLRHKCEPDCPNSTRFDEGLPYPVN